MRNSVPRRVIASVVFCAAGLAPQAARAQEPSASAAFELEVGVDVENYTKLQGEAAFELGDARAAVFAEIEREDAEIAGADLWLMAGPANAMWSVGLRHEFEPVGQTALAARLAWTPVPEGTVGVSLFAYESGMTGLRLESELERSLANRWFVGVSAEAEAWSREHATQDRWSGLNMIELRAHLSYEVSDTASVFLAYTWKAAVGDARDMRTAADDETSEGFFGIGLRAAT